jgi:hypothetical protein
VSNLLQSLLLALCLGITPAIQRIPTAVLWGYFVFMAVESLAGSQLWERLLLLATDPKRRVAVMQQEHAAYLQVCRRQGRAAPAATLVLPFQQFRQYATAGMCWWHSMNICSLGQIEALRAHVVYRLHGPAAAFCRCFCSWCRSVWWCASRCCSWPTCWVCGR